MGKKWTKIEKDILIKEYPKKGAKYCSDNLNRTIISIQSMSGKLNLKLNSDAKTKNLKKSHIKTFDKYKIHPAQFLNIKTPEVAYFLGFLWADGHITKKYYNINIEIQEDDMIELITHFNKIGIWNEYIRKRKNWKTQSQISTSNYHIHQFLSENDYLDKSQKSPNKILNKIPINLQHYFFRGWIDGDGCFRENKGNYFFAIAGTANQPWASFKNVLKHVFIKNYKIINIKNKKGSGDILKITNKKDIVKLGDYIYKNYESDKIGLSRKYNIYKTIKEKSYVGRFLTDKQRELAKDKNLGNKNPAYKHLDMSRIKYLWENGYNMRQISIDLSTNGELIKRRLRELNLI